MKEQIEILVKLQKVETETGDIRSLLDALPQRLENLDAEVMAFQQTLEEDEKLVNDIKKDYRMYESDSQTGISQIEKSQAKLRSVKTNKEYQSLLKEIEDTKEINSKIEDKMLECLDRIEEMEAVVERKQTELSTLTDRVDREKENIRKETREGEKRLAWLDTERQKISAMIEPGLLKTFNTIKKKRKRLAIVPVQDAVCLGCHMNIPPQLYNEIQRFDSLKLCPNCQRMLYWEEPSNRPE